MKKGIDEKRREYMLSMQQVYGVEIKEYRQIGQRCGYFHITFPIFILDQEPGSEPIGFMDPITEYTEAKMKQVVNHKLFADEWYLEMCKAWKSKDLILMSIEKPVVYEEKSEWQD